MRRSIALFVVVWAIGASALGAGETGPGFDWSPWRYLPVQDGGRRKPLDTLARETMRSLSDRTSFTDPETGRKLDSVALYLAMLFDWQGWDKPADARVTPEAHPALGYFDLYQADKWDRAPLIRVRSAELRKALGLDQSQRRFSAHELSESFKELLRGDRDDLSRVEEDAQEVVGRLWLYQQHRAGERLYLLPERDSPEQHWISARDLLRADFDDRADAARLREVKKHLEQARAAYLAGSPAEFRRATGAFITAVRRIGPDLGAYPSRVTIDLEVAYNRWAPFSIAWMLSLSALVCLDLNILARWLNMLTRWKGLSIAGMTFFAGSLAVMLMGFAVRAAVSGRVPVTNLYESVVFAAFGALVFGLVFGLLARKEYVFAAAAAVATLALLLADYFPSVLDPRIRPLMPVLRSNFWLAVHVVTIMLSYAAFALAWAIGNITLYYFMLGSKGREALNARARLIYKTLQVGVLLLVVGTILGAFWADYSWGRFWDWDPKEVWALVTLLGYLALLHARLAGWVGNRGLVAWSQVCFCLVVVTWYLANMLPGLHEYGLGAGGQFYVWGAIALELLAVVVAVVWSVLGDRIAAVNQPSPAG